MRKHTICIFLISSCILSIIRCILPLHLTSDPSIQINAALNLFDGEGMTLHSLSYDIAQPPIKYPLTWFPPGFSLLIFLFLWLGLPLAVALKLIYTAATVFGWYGWALVFKKVIYLTRETTIFTNFYILAFAIVLPLYFTFDWCGTELFLWAGLPWLIILIYSTERKNNTPIKFLFTRYFLIGSLVGLLYSFRYAAAFLLLPILLLAWNSKGKFLKIFGCFLGFAVFYIPLLVYKLYAGSYESRFSILSVFDNLLLTVKTVFDINNLKNIEILFFSHLSHNLLSDILFLVWLPIVAYSSFYIYRNRQALLMHPGKDRKNLFLLLKIIGLINAFLIIFLVFANIFDSVKINYFAEERLYYPLFPSMLFLSYSVVFLRGKLDNKNRKTSNLFAMISAILLVQIAFLFNPYEVWGFYYNPFRFSHLKNMSLPSNDISMRKPNSYHKLVGLLQQNTASIAISQAQDFDFYHDRNSQLRERIVSKGAELVNGNYWSSKELEVYFIFDIEQDCPSYCYLDTNKPAKFIDSLPNSKIVYRNELEAIQIIATTIPKGFRFKDSKPLSWIEKK